jgi:hypothetical protein
MDYFVAYVLKKYCVRNLLSDFLHRVSVFWRTFKLHYWVSNDIEALGSAEIAANTSSSWSSLIHQYLFTLVSITCMDERPHCLYRHCQITSMLKSNSREHSSSWETNTHSAGQRLPAFYGNWMFITVSRRAATGPVPNIMTPAHVHTTYLRLTLILSSRGMSWLNGQHTCSVFGRSWIQIPARRRANLTKGFFVAFLRPFKKFCGSFLR